MCDIFSNDFRFARHSLLEAQASCLQPAKAAKLLPLTLGAPASCRKFSAAALAVASYRRDVRDSVCAAPAGRGRSDSSSGGLHHRLMSQCPFGTMHVRAGRGRSREVVSSQELARSQGQGAKACRMWLMAKADGTPATLFHPPFVNCSPSLPTPDCLRERGRLACTTAQPSGQWGSLSTGFANCSCFFAVCWGSLAVC